jgi:hypothetical protein
MMPRISRNRTTTKAKKHSSPSADLYDTRRARRTFLGLLSLCKIQDSNDMSKTAHINKPCFVRELINKFRAQTKMINKYYVSTKERTWVEVS